VQLKQKLTVIPSPPPLHTHAKTMVFYQYAFTKKEIMGMLQQNGFTITDISYYDAWKGLKDELWPFSQINKNKKLADKCRGWFERKCLFPHLVHMIAFVCKKD
jgi:hypothetical protein